MIEPKFDHAEGFSEGLAAVAVGEKWGVIDHSGQFVVTPRFECLYRHRFPIEEFADGLARVSATDTPRPDKQGYIDRTGRFVWEPTN